MLNRAFDVDRPNEVWVSDITYLSSRSGWLYLVVFIDLFSRRVVGWCVSTSLAHETVVRPCGSMATRPQPGLMIHSVFSIAARKSTRISLSKAWQEG